MSGRSKFAFGGFKGLAERTSLRYRRKMFEDVMREMVCDSRMRVLDVGVTTGDREDCNFFERWYAYPQNITAVGLEDCRFLEQSYPGLKFVQADGRKLPFADKSFDLAVSFAVVEHVGSRAEQAEFIRELCRVSRRVCLTTPNRWHPIDFHTVLPLIHWLPAKVARMIWRALGHEFFSKEENLNLLSERQLLSLVPKDRRARVTKYRFLGAVSNFMLWVVE